MNLYYEVSDSQVNQFGGKYWVSDSPWAVRRRLMEVSDRVWKEDGTAVGFMKNRFNHNAILPDMKEFMWIKLQSKHI